MMQDSNSVIWNSLDYREVGFLNLSFPELFGKPGSGLAGLGEDHNSRNRLIKPMNDAEKNIARLGVSLLEVFLGIVKKGISLDFAMCRWQSSGLGKNQKVIVFQ